MLHIESTLLRVCFCLVSLIGITIFAIPAFRGILNIGNAFGMTFFFILLIFFTFNKFISETLTNIWHYTLGKTFIIILLSLLVIGVIIASLITVAMIHSASRRPPSSNTTVIVLGCKVNGTEPSLMLSKRLDTAYDYLIENPNVRAIVSGGQGDNEDISEAECMKTYLTKRGVPSERIIMEDTSTSTYENLKNSLETIKKNNMNTSITIVTDGFHQFRSELIANNLGIKNISAVSAKTSLWLVPTYWVREWFGVTYQLISN